MLTLWQMRRYGIIRSREPSLTVITLSEPNVPTYTALPSEGVNFTR